MTEVYIDDARLDFEDTDGSATIEELANAIESETVKIKRFVAGVRADGAVLDDWRGSGQHGTRLSSYAQIRFKTASLEEFALSSIDTVQEYIKVTKDNIVSFINDINTSSVRADGAFKAVFEGFVEILKTIDAMTKLGAQYNVEFFRKNPQTYCESLLRHLGAVKDARNSADTVVLKDVLEYEMLPLLEEMEVRLFSRNEA